MSLEGIIGTSLGVLGLITGYIFYRRSLRTKEPSFALRTNNLIRNHISAIDGLEVFYKNQKVNNLSVTKMMFWNNGAETIERQHITRTNPLVIFSEEEIQLLDAKVLISNNKASEFSCTLQDKNHALIDFEYLDKGQGAIIQIIHTGISNKNIKIAGQIKGVRAMYMRNFRYHKEVLPLIFIDNTRLGPTARRRITFLFLLFSGLFFTFIGGTVISLIYLNGGNLPEAQPPSPGGQPVDPILVFLIAPLFLFAGLGLLGLSYLVFLERLPLGLEIFDEESISIADDS